jgi:alpha-tubulin suppressor-like RCC1 family protein
MIVRHDNFGDVGGKITDALPQRTIASTYDAMAAIDNKRLWAWGFVQSTQSGFDPVATFGQGWTTATSYIAQTPQLVPSLLRRDVHGVEAADYASCVIVGSDRQLLAAGKNTNSKLCVGHTDNVVRDYTPVVRYGNVPTTGVSKMCMSVYGLVALLDSGWVVAGGAMLYVVGAGATNSYLATLDRVNWEDKKVVDIALAQYNTYVLTEDGAVYCSGVASPVYWQGQTGPDTSNAWRRLPVLNNEAVTFKRIVALEQQAYAISTAGDLYVIGYNYNCQLGTGNNVNVQYLTKSMANISGPVRDVSGCREYTHVICDNGDIFFSGVAGSGSSGGGIQTETRTSWHKIVGKIDDRIHVTGFYSAGLGSGIGVDKAGAVYTVGRGGNYATDFNSTSNKLNFTNLLTFPRAKVRPPDPNLYPKADDFSMGRGKFFEDLTAATPGLAEWDGTLKITSTPFGLDWPDNSNITCGMLINEEEIIIAADINNGTSIGGGYESIYVLNLATGAFTSLYKSAPGPRAMRLYKGLYGTGRAPYVRANFFGVLLSNGPPADTGIYFSGHNFRLDSNTVLPSVRMVANANGDAIGALLGQDVRYPVSPGICTNLGKLIIQGGSNGAIVEIEANGFVGTVLSTGNTPFRSEVAIADRGNGWVAFVGYKNDNFICYYPFTDRTEMKTLTGLGAYGAIGAIENYWSTSETMLLAPTALTTSALRYLAVSPWGSSATLSQSTPNRFMGAKTVGNGIGVMLPHHQDATGRNARTATAVKMTQGLITWTKDTASPSGYNGSTGALHRGIIYRGNKLHWFTPKEFHTAELVGVKPPPIEYQLHPYLNHT